MAKAEKILVLGIDGMDPRLTKYHLDQGHMPNLAKFLARGSAREDLVLLGGMPTITPPMWTTLCTGAYPMTHGITDFWRQNPEKLETYGYALDSRLCQAEQMWNVFAEAGKKTLVWHWPGSSWPPSSKSENLFVVDGTNPEGICMGTGQIDWEYLAVATDKMKEVTFRSAVGESSHMCVITDIEMTEEKDSSGSKEFMHMMATAPDITLVTLPKKEGAESFDMTNQALDASMSPIKPATDWTVAVPEGAKELTILFSRGLVRRMALLTKNKAGVYDTIAIYKNKKATAPIITLKNNEFVEAVVDEAIKNDKVYTVARNMRVLTIEEDGSIVKLWISAGVDIHDDSVFSPKSLHKEITENVGYPMPVSNLGSADKQLIVDCMQENWMRTMRWWADGLHYMIENKGMEVVFSHVHNDDAQKHMFIKYAQEGGGGSLPDEDYLDFLVAISQQNDYYLGRFLHFLDEGWTIFLVSDHGLISPIYEQTLIGGSGIDAKYMRDWGFTEVMYDENGELLPQIDWSKTKAVFTRMNEIYINLKGRYATGIVEPEDKYELEEQIMAKLYGLRDHRGHRVVSLALRNKDAALIGLGGPECGDIIVMSSEGYNGDHGDSLSTFWGKSHTSVSPIFAAAGKGIKAGYKTTRVIREVDVAPTIAALTGMRMPAQCEGAPVYQILVD